ncbi:hypothetical protein BDZ91DRAFT_424432 [Kalaharituber pfeilii]|nr:hypothetical protein BDZ91DRAFT_424432 [Kalaharituber pfeilii]
MNKSFDEQTDAELRAVIDYENIRTILADLRHLVQTSEEVRAEVTAEFQARIAELEQENKILDTENNDALLLQKAQDELDLPDDYDMSPILERRVANLKINLQRVREQSRKKEERYLKQIEQLEELAFTRLDEIVRAINTLLGRENAVRRLYLEKEASARQTEYASQTKVSTTHSDPTTP